MQGRKLSHQQQVLNTFPIRSIILLEANMSDVFVGTCWDAFFGWSAVVRSEVKLTEHFAFSLGLYFRSIKRLLSALLLLVLKFCHLRFVSVLPLLLPAFPFLIL